MKRKVAVGAIIISIVLALWGGSFFVVTRAWVRGEHTDEGPAAIDRYGLFGDSFGAVNSLFSGLALIGVVLAIFLQREDLKLQREDFRASLDAQERAVRMQQFQVRIAALSSALQAKESIKSVFEAERGKTTTVVDGQETDSVELAIKIANTNAMKINMQLNTELEKMYPGLLAQDMNIIAGNAGDAQRLWIDYPAE
ncbi:MAG: hypothetical protein J7M14_05455 [Planctomycetes bacterium]|nr:hypothetical protein [Planctomycetota bacterium]